MSDPTEAIRLQLAADINAKEGSREWLEAKYGQVWDTNQLQEDFEVIGFLAPFISCRRKSDSKKGSLTFQARPRFYFDFMAD